MFWFYDLSCPILWTLSSFKYILCFGSTKFVEVFKKAEDRFKYILCFGSTDYSKTKGLSPLIFKYILCFGST